MLKKQIPQLRFREFKENYVQSRLGDVFSIFNGYAFKSIDATQEGVRWLKIADVGVQDIKSGKPSYLPLGFNHKHPKFLLAKGDYVIALTRPVLSHRLKVAKINDEYDGALLNQRVGKIVSNQKKDFIYYLLQCGHIIFDIENRIDGTDPPNLSPNEIKGIKCSIPKRFDEQNKIADFLSTIDKKISMLKEKCSINVLYKKSVMQKLLTQEVRFKDENGNNFPDWKEEHFSNMLILQLNPLKMDDEREYELITVRRRNRGVDSRGIYKGKEVLVKSQFELKTNQFVISKRQIVHGACGLVPKELAGAIVSNEYNVFDPVPEKLDINYFNMIATSLPMRRAFFINSDGVHIEKLLFKTQSWLKTKLDFPCIEEQQKIVSFIETLDKKIDLINQQIEQTQTFKKGLLQQMFV